MLLMNIPVGANGNQQFVMNTISGAWAQFTGWDAICWAVMDDELYFGATDAVNKAWDGNKDGDNNIRAECLQAFSGFGSTARQKHFKLVRPIISVGGADANGFGLKIAINTEYNQSPPAG